MPPARTIGPSKKARTARTNTKGLSQPVWPPAPAVEQHEAVGAGRDRALGVADAGDVGKDKRAGVMQRRRDRRGRTDRGDDDLRLVTEQHGKILLQPRVGTVHDQVRAYRRGALAAGVKMAAQLPFDVAEPIIELFGAAAIHGRKRADHAIAAGGYHQIDAGDQKHRRRDQRQIEAIAKSREGIG